MLNEMIKKSETSCERTCERIIEESFDNLFIKVPGDISIDIFEYVGDFTTLHFEKENNFLDELIKVQKENNDDEDLKITIYSSVKEKKMEGKLKIFLPSKIKIKIIDIVTENGNVIIGNYSQRWQSIIGTLNVHSNLGKVKIYNACDFQKIFIRTFSTKEIFVNTNVLTEKDRLESISVINNGDIEIKVGCGFYFSQQKKNIPIIGDIFLGGYTRKISLNLKSNRIIRIS